MGAVQRTKALRLSAARALSLALVMAACAGAPPRQPPPERAGRPLPPPLPDTTGWGVHVLVLARSPELGLWAGTHGRGIYVLPDGEQEWRHIASGTGTGALASSYVNSIGFTESGTVWYGSVGDGFGVSSDTGATWRSWGPDELGSEWRYVAPHGIVTRGDTVYIATTTGLRITRDGGTTWSCVRAADAGQGAAAGGAGCGERAATLQSDYLLSLDVGPEGEVWLGHLEGVSLSEDGGRTWRQLAAAEGIPAERMRAVAVNTDSIVWAASESEIYVDSAGDRQFTRAQLRLPGWPGLPGAPRALVPSPGGSPPSIATSFGLAAASGAGQYRMYYLGAGESYRPAADMWDMTWWGPPLWPIGASAAGLNRVLAGESRTTGQSRATPAGAPADPRHAWFARPIALERANPYVDGSHLFGATRGGTLPVQPGADFNNPRGTPVHAIGDGVVVSAGADEAESNAITIRHERPAGGLFLHSVYRYNSSVDVQPGQRVSAGDVIARVGSSGAPASRLRLELHAAQDTALLDAQDGLPSNALNPQLWIEPLPGTGVVAGRVSDADGELVPAARIYGLVLPYPEETPFSFVETYADGTRSSPGYDENFAVGDVPAGEYRLGVEIAGTRVWRRIRVEPGKVTFVEFQP